MDLRKHLYCSRSAKREKRLAWCALIALIALILFFSASFAHGQDIGNVGLRTSQTLVFNAVTGAITSPLTCSGVKPAAGTAGCIQNLGQTVHVLTYSIGGTGTAGFVQIRLEGSTDGINFFPISDDATDLSGGEVIGIGFYPAIRANLVNCGGCGANPLTASYSGSFMPGNYPSGFYNPSQQIRKVIVQQGTVTSSLHTNGIVSPFGSANGHLIFQLNGGSYGTGTTVTVTAHMGSNTWTYGPITLTATYTDLLIQPTPATSIDIFYSYGGSGGSSSYNTYYVFTQPGAWNATEQPEVRSNLELTSSANAAVSQPLGGAAATRAHLYSVSARCSAGTAQLTVNDNGTQVFSSGATEVTTTTYRFQWEPGLAGSPSANLTVALSACGASNTGTLDIQSSNY